MILWRTNPINVTSTAAVGQLTAGDLVGEVRRQQAIDLVGRVLDEQSRLYREDRNDQLYDLCLDLLNILRPAAPAVPGRP